MKSMKAVYDNGHLMFPDGNVPEGRMDVVVVFPDKTQPAPPRDTNAGRRFVEKWSGVLQEVDLDNWREQRIAELERKHQ